MQVRRGADWKVEQGVEGPVAGRGAGRLCFDQDIECRQNRTGGFLAAAGERRGREWGTVQSKARCRSGTYMADGAENGDCAQCT